MRIAYITDTHLGAAAEDWHQQPRWVGGVPALIRRLRLWCDEQDVGLVIHGGDVVHVATYSQIQLAAALLGSLGRPVMVSLGNHDLTEADSMDNWRRIAGQQRNMFVEDTHLPFDDCDVIVMNNHWSSAEASGMHWTGAKPYAEFVTTEQLAWLDKAFAAQRSKPAILAIHSPIDALPPELTGMDTMYKVPDAAYAAAMHELFVRHPRARLVLGGHNHVTHAIRHGDRVDLSTSSLTEVPFQLRLIDVLPDRIDVTTPTLGPGPENLVIDAARAWTTGRESDRTISL